MLILFDIDATLLTTTRAGVHAMGRAGRRLFGGSFDESRVEYSGRLDPLIIADLLTTHERPAGPEDIGRFRDAYREHLAVLLETPGIAAPCPGVVALLDELATAVPHATLGLLTGNFPETGELKLRAAGIDPDRFPIRAWGSDSPHDPPARDHLPPVAMERFRAHTGEAIEPGRVTIIGDTPHDVACAHAHGCRCLAVATGLFTSEQLDAAGADRTFETLEDLGSVMGWLLEREAAGER
jgi:phosphoglycolate phosphatase